ncbi:acyl-CoA dehydrogenase family protein [Oceanobacillus profundus]|uniref:acyl-CoA dehydrogenase family protein n=1 Tax=Oceanobacillus profundus TaxID=372463 RepID=UPI0026E3002B|nr:acyl-CoA dehydrogenase family protein [Oceanobacillus profundus]MDO6449393.1 acyl-CoA dehydrogenase family protein [Oceanobacillus profundus]
MEKVESTNKHTLFPNEQSVISLDFQEEEKLIARTIDKFIQEHVNPSIKNLEAYDYELAKKLFRDAGDLGLLGADVPELYDGMELGKKTAGLVAERMGYGASFSVSFNIHTGVGTLPYVYFGTPEQKERYLPKLVSGEWVGAYALTEPNAGSDALASETSAVLDEKSGEWVLNGEKQWITNAHIASVFVVFAKTESGITAFIVERSMSGVSIGLEEKKMGIKGSSTATLILENVRLSTDQVLGQIGKGHYIALNILNLARLKLAFANVGTAKQALSLAVNYGKARKQFKQELTRFTMIQEKLANMALAIFASECAAYVAANRLDELHVNSSNEDDILGKLSNYAVDCSINKVYASEALDFIVDEALQIHGGYGYMQEYEVERLYRDARINRLFEGTSEINRLTIVRSFLKLYHKDKSIIEQDETQIHSQNLYIHYSKELLNIIMKAFSDGDNVVLKQDQEIQRMLADVIKEIYVMESVQLTAQATRSNQDLKETMAEVLCEEGYFGIERNTVVIISSIISNDDKKQAFLDEINSFNLPMYSNLVAKKRKIAMEVISNNGYKK